jgi:hypothetical protein
MQRLNAAKFTPETKLTLQEFVENIYLPFIESETRASTKKGYREIWKQSQRDRIGDIRVREFRTVHASRMRAMADENDLSKTTLQHIKSVLSGIFTHAKNEGAFDGANPIQGTRIPSNARDPRETYAYNLSQICRILGGPAVAAQGSRRHGVLCRTP